jgi:hypothetical protein
MAGCSWCRPAIWLLGADRQRPADLVDGGADPPWCRCAPAGSEEIDIAEFFSHSGFTSVRNATINGASGSCTDAAFGTSRIGDASTTSHTYKLAAGSRVVEHDLPHVQARGGLTRSWAAAGLGW